MRLASKSATRLFGSKCRSQAVAAKPVKPPPTMAKSTSSGTASCSEWKSIVQGGKPHRGIRAAFTDRVAPMYSRNPPVRYHRMRPVAEITLTGFALSLLDAGVHRTPYCTLGMENDTFRSPDQCAPAVCALLRTHYQKLRDIHVWTP